MKISFVIPAYNEADCLPACLQAILEQKSSAQCEVEIVVVNNASTDETRRVALSFPGVTVVDEPRKGITFARQAGLAAASGDLIANVDADSILTPGWLRTVAAQFAQREKLVALSGPFIYYDISPAANLPIRLYYCFGYIAYIANRFILRAGSLLQGGNFVVRRSALERIGGFDTSIAFYGEDTDIARRLSKIGPTLFTFGLPMYSSARRLKFEGLLTMAVKYPINFFWETFFKRPFTKDYIDIRTASPATGVVRTSVERFHTELRAVQVSFAVILLSLFGGIGYIYHEVTVFASVPVAQAEQSTPKLVKTFGPIIKKMQDRVHAWEADADGR